MKGASVETLLGNEACSAAAQHAVFSLGSEQNRGSTDGCPETIIIVNTHNFDKEMVIARRTAYQKILALEKKGVQVVERDLRQPVDIIVSASACLAWYDCKNIAKKATAPDEAFSCLPLCVENIAASILTSLSFAFSGCILVSTMFFFPNCSHLHSVVLDVRYALHLSQKEHWKTKKTNKQWTCDI